ncbi:MAG: response regulator [Nitrospiraceae bacterium]|nr:MAG: response regulator [Nitrospiraceae bacterium]
MEGKTKTKAQPVNKQTTASRIEKQSYITPGNIFTYPRRLAIILMVTIFLIEAVVMCILRILPPLPIAAEAILDSFLLVIIVYPLLHFLVFKPYITERQKLEQQLLHSQRLEAVGQLAGGIAHDFNNILTTIMGYGSLIKMEMKENDHLRNHVEQILSSAEMASTLTQNLLAFSRKQIINPQPVKLNEIITKTEKILSRLVGEDIELKTILAEDMTIIADSGQIEQVLMNLATNARDSMPRGGALTFETDIVELDKKFQETHGFGRPGVYGMISVTDSGIGMDKNTRERVFEPFFTTKEIGKGTGLGLSMVYGIVKQHNGFINVYSEPSKGTTFKIYLPLIEAEAKEISITKLPSLQGGTETILVAEDDESVRKLTRDILEKFGYRVIVAEDGEDAVNKFMENKNKINLLLLDVIMPKREGKEVYEEIKGIKPDVKALFLSGYSEDLLQKKGVLEKGLHFIFKPVAVNDLLRKVREVLDK